MAETSHFCELLLAEHRETERLLEKMQALLDQGDQWALMGKLFQTLCTDLDRHFACEEHGLFPVLSQYRTMILMEVEHDDLVEARQALQHQLEMSIAHQEEAEGLRRSYEQFQERLKAHILEEERGIFPLAESVLEPEEKALVRRKLAEVSQRLLNEPAGQPLRENPVPTYTVYQNNLMQPSSQPIHYDKLFKQEHVTLQHIQILAGQALKPHWAPEHQCILLLSGKALFLTEQEEHVLLPGAQVTVEPKLRFALKAEKDSHFLMIKVWPRPHFIRAVSERI